LSVKLPDSPHDVGPGNATVDAVALVGVPT
jgi:hypothetical protein